MIGRARIRRRVVIYCIYAGVSGGESRSLRVVKLIPLAC